MQTRPFKDICQIRAPAKAILCGEHAVVYNEDALAMAISLYCRGLISNKQKGSSQASLEIELEIESKKISVSSQILTFFSTLFKEATYKGQYAHFEKRILQVLPDSRQNSEHCLSIHFKIGIFLLIYKVDWEEFMTNGQQDYLVKVSSDIPFGKCLGSSAAFNTVLATLLLGLFDKINLKQLDAKAKEMINSLSVQFQSVEHGTPSGIDNFVSVHGGLILFNRSKDPKFRQLARATSRLQSCFDIAVADSNVEKNTKWAVEMVRARCQASEQDNHKIKEIGQISTLILHLLEDEAEEVQCKQIFELINKNHELLRELGLSCEQIERLVQLGAQNGWSAKITGSGMGGCILLLAKAKEGIVVQNIRLAQLDREGLVIDYFK